jgi:hypothetical protein
MSIQSTSRAPPDVGEKGSVAAPLADCIDSRCLLASSSYSLLLRGSLGFAGFSVSVRAGDHDPGNEADRALFAGASVLSVLLRDRSDSFARPNPARQAALALLICWAPLALLTTVEGTFLGASNADAFVFDMAVHTRFLIVLPLFAFASNVMLPRLGAVIRYFAEMDLVQAVDRPRYDAAVETARRLNASLTAAVLLVACAYVIVSVFVYARPVEALDIPAWHLAKGNGEGLSWAGHWHAAVSLPFLLIAFLRLLWRWCVWTALLWRISRLPLALVSGHPDRAAGLRFVSYSVRAYTMHAFLLGVVLVGSIANPILYEGARLDAYTHLVLGFLIFVLMFFVSPVLVFTGNLLKAWRNGVFAYGALADRVGREFELEWLARGRNIDRTALARQDFSAMTDLYSTVANVYAMRPVLVDFGSILLLIAASALPFLPLVFLALPIDTILAKLSDVLL